MKVIGRVPQLMPGGRGQAKVARKHTATAQKAHQVRGGKAVMKLSRPAREILAESYLLPYTGFLRHFGRTRQFWTVESNSKYAPDADAGREGQLELGRMMMMMGKEEEGEKHRPRPEGGEKVDPPTTFLSLPEPLAPR